MLKKLKKLKYLIDNYYEIHYLVEHFGDIRYLIDYIDVYKALDKKVYNIEATLEGIKLSNDTTKRYSVAGVPKEHKEYIAKLMEDEEVDKISMGS